MPIHAFEYLSELACFCRICFWAKCTNVTSLIYLHEDPQLEAICSVPNPKAGYILSVSLPSSALDVNLVFVLRGMFGLGPLLEIVCLRRDSPITVKSSVKQDLRRYEHLSSFTSPACLKRFINISSAQSLSVDTGYI